MNKIGVIDLGTNTFNLLVAEILNHQKATYIHKDKIPVKIGQGGITKNVILPEAMERGLIALGTYANQLKSHNVKTLYALGTSALRSADNSNDFVLRAWNELGIFVNVISGMEEADLIFQGVCNALPLDSAIRLIMDIGGGSTEFILFEKDKLLWKESFDLGAARILEQLEPSDPIQQSDIETLEALLEKELDPLWKIALIHSPNALIGSSGSFDSFSEMIQPGVTNDTSLEGTFYNHISIEKYNLIYKKLIKSTREERLKFKGLIPMRVDMIVIAAIMTNYILKRLQIQQLTQSAFALKEGVLERLKKNDHKWLKSSL